MLYRKYSSLCIAGKRVNVPCLWNKINIAMNGSFVEHRLEAEDYVIVINTHKEEIKRLKVHNTNPQFLLWNQQLLWCVYLSYIQNQMLQHQEYISRLQEELQSAR